MIGGQWLCHSPGAWLVVGYPGNSHSLKKQPGVLLSSLPKTAQKTGIKDIQEKSQALPRVLAEFC